MVGNLLARGMIVGIIAALLSFTFLKIVGEPTVDRAIAFETQMDEAKAEAEKAAAIAKGLPAPTKEEEPELVSRPTQAGIGLLTGVTIYNVAFGGLFALVFAVCYGRMGRYSARTTSALLALSGIVAVYIVPILKYPANPPSVGNPETITQRTEFFFSMILISLAMMIAAWMLRNRLDRRLGAWNAGIVAALAYAAVMVVVAQLLPVVNEVPEGFPAVTLWQFRMASLGAQIIMWGTIGLGFGAWVERASFGSALRLRTA